MGFTWVHSNDITLYGNFTVWVKHPYPTPTQYDGNFDNYRKLKVLGNKERRLPNVATIKIWEPCNQIIRRSSWNLESISKNSLFHPLSKDKRKYHSSVRSEHFTANSAVGSLNLAADSWVRGRSRADVNHSSQDALPIGMCRNWKWTWYGRKVNNFQGN